MLELELGSLCGAVFFMSSICARCYRYCRGMHLLGSLCDAVSVRVLMFFAFVIVPLRLIGGHSVRIVIYLRSISTTAPPCFMLLEWCGQDSVGYQQCYSTAHCALSFCVFSHRRNFVLVQVFEVIQPQVGIASKGQGIDLSSLPCASRANKFFHAAPAGGGLALPMQR